MSAILTLTNMFFFHDKIVRFIDAIGADDSPDESEIEAKAQSSEVALHQTNTDKGGLSFSEIESPQVGVNHPMKDNSSDKNTNPNSQRRN